MFDYFSLNIKYKSVVELLFIWSVEWSDEWCTVSDDDDL